MDELLRQRFEAWAHRHFVRIPVGDNPVQREGDGYAGNVGLAWIAWHAALTSAAGPRPTASYEWSVGPCPDPNCDGRGTTFTVQTVHGCCGSPLPTGECCGNAVPVVEQVPQQCQWCFERDTAVKESERGS